MDREIYIWSDTQDQSHASELARFLESVGISAWYPEIGPRYNLDPVEMLNNSRVLLLLWSTNTKVSEVTLLVRLALTEAKLIVPVSLDGTSPTGPCGADLSDYVWHELTENSRLQRQRLAQTLIRRLGSIENASEVDKGLHAVRLALTTTATHKAPTLRDACKILSAAIEHGVPIYNAGDKYGCARIYEMAARLLAGAVLSYDLEASKAQRTVIDEIQRVLQSHGYASADNAESFAWDLRDAFDALLERCYQTTAAPAVESIESRFATVQDPTSGDIRRLILYAISQGAPLYNQGFHRECAQIYLKAASIAIELADRAQQRRSTGGDFFKNVARRLRLILADSEVATLNPQDKYNWVIEHKAEKFAWDLRHAFEGILEFSFVSDDSLSIDSKSEAEDKLDTTQGKQAKPVFISYARVDNASVDPTRRWLDRLLQQLKPFIRQADLEVWSDEDLKVGHNWHAEIQQRLENAKAAVLLISPAFLASDYIANSELPVLLKRARGKGLTIIPILVSPCLYHKVWFKYPDPKIGPESMLLSEIQSANPPSRTLDEMSIPEQNRVLVKVAEDLLGILENA